MRIPGQTLFLGASVVSYNANMGWGGSASSLQVELIEDVQPFGKVPHRKFDQNKSADYGDLFISDDSVSVLPREHPGNRNLGPDFYTINHYIPGSYEDNHYYSCSGDDCYVDELGRPYSSSPTKKERNVPGKVYYQWVNNRFVSKYWYSEDPGFFATGTRINPNGDYELERARGPGTGDLYIYDIINTPVYFKFDNFEFIGLVKSWERNNRPGGITYTVNLESFSSLLDNCWVILDKYGGSIFGKRSIPLPGLLTKGTPVNNVDTSLFNYNGLLSEGNIPNIFNVYGFLESFGIDFFGGSNYNDQGISAIDVLQGLSALTSSHTRLDRDSAYSPFGRILTKTIATVDGNIAPGIFNFGIISPNIGTQRFPVNNVSPGNYNSFSLDLSDIGRLIPDYRISGSKNITDLLRTVSEASGSDYTIKVIPAITNNRLYQFVIKVISVDRTTYRSPYNIRSIITNLENSNLNINISNSSFGQETNDNVTNKFIIGGPQQRLLQVKNYRLSHNQTNYVYNPILKRFISLNKPWNKARVPDVMSTRHPVISNLSLGSYIGDRININDVERNTRFSTFTDPLWADTQVSAIGRSEGIIKGNYRNSVLNLAPFHSRIVTTGDLNPDVRTVEPKQPCVVDWSLVTNADLEMPDDSCSYYTRGVVCPIKEITGPGCSDNPEQEGGTGYLNDPTLDENPDLSEGGFEPVTDYDQPNSRYLNLQNDWICPYFGRALEQKMPVADDTNEYRSVRPVFLDIWTNQIAVAFNMHELPTLSIGEPLSLYDQTIFNTGTFFSGATGGLTRNGADVSREGRGATTATRDGRPIPRDQSPDSNNWSPVGDPKRTFVLGTPGFIITESEMRSALAGFDSYFSYCLGKSNFSKPDLFLMLLSAYKNSGQLFANIDNYFGDIEVGNAGLTRGAADLRGTNTSFGGIPTIPHGIQPTNLDMNFSLLLNHNFVKDLQIICEFIKNIADTYYGKQYLVKLPDMILYKDRQYSNIRIPGAFGNISVYTGSSKTFANYELAEGAWEEPGNFIDDCIVVGDNFSKVFMNENNLIEPIVGYNNSLNIDDVRQEWCRRDVELRIKALYNNLKVDGASDIFQQLENLQTEIDSIISPLFTPVGRPISNEQWDRVSTRINNLIDRFKNNRNLIGLKELRTFGHTINCLSSISMSHIYEQWNNMWSSMSATVSRNNLETISYSMTILANQWRTIVQDAEAGSLDLVLLTFSVPSLDLSSLGGDDDFVIVPVSSKKEPFDRQSPRSSKLFRKCSKDRIVFMNLTNFTDPRAIMVLNSKLDVFNSSLAYAKDPGISVISNIAIEDSALYIRLKNRLNSAREARNEALESGDTDKAREILNSINVLKKEVDYIRMLKYYIVPEIDPRYLVTTGPTSNPSVNHALMVPRAAHPSFFGIPLKSNQFCYGPWTNYADNIIPSPFINNLIHKTSVEQVDDLVPWNYGGSSALDSVVAYRLNSDVNYQTILENGTISIIGPPLFGLGGVFNDDPDRIVVNAFRFDNGWYRPLYAPYIFYDTKRNGYRQLTYNCIKLIHKEVNIDGPLISSLSIQVGNDGVTTSYRFQTYNPKTGLYNKTYEDALKQMSVDRSKFQKAISDIQKNISNKLTIENSKILNLAKDNRFPASISKHQTSLYGKSPIEIFVGQGLEVLKNPVWYSNLPNINDPGDFPIPAGTTIEDREKFLNQRRNYSWVGGVMGIEIGAELQQEYNNKSAMSLDGLLSPVSFYPTKANRTYSISSYVGGSGVPVGDGSVNTTCPYCYNERVISVPFIDYHGSSFDAVTLPGNDTKIPCPVCSRAKINVIKNDKNPDRETGLPDINVYSLNPIVVSEGEFRNPYASGIDRCRHSISVVSRGEYNPIDESLYSPSNINSYRNGYNPDYSKFDTKVQELEGKNILLNQRFMALRGPLMIHGWGFDTDGYPVPNALDMPYSINKEGIPLRFQLISDTGNKKFAQNDLDLHGKYVPAQNDISPLGDIITKRYEWKGQVGTGIESGTGKWVKKSKPSKKFYLNWAERQDTWPVGPVDLRWDDKRKVWDASGGGCKEEVLPPFIISDKSDLSTLNEFLDNRTENKCPYKMVYLTLEQDMTRQANFESTIPARAFIDDIEYSKEPLQNTFRRLVYIMDSTGYTAPRGAKLLCRYNRDNGFYEPVTKPTLTALGTINSSSQAKIDMSYTQGRRSNTIPTFVVNFANPLVLNTSSGKKGLFNYINGQWTLVSTG